MLWLPSAVPAQPQLPEGFVHPPQSARPQVWWHWMNGNISLEGIRKDLCWMQAAGLSGFHLFDAGLEVPQVVPERVAFLSPAWKEAFRLSMELADSLGLTATVASSPGWSATGAPWVPAEESMKTLNWKSLDVEGRRRFRGPLPEPDSVAGKYLSHVLNRTMPERYRFYKDLYVYAVKIPDVDRPMEELGVRLSSSDGSDLRALQDGNLMSRCTVMPDSSGKAWVLFTFPERQTVQSVMQGFDDDWRDRSGYRWEYSDDGIRFQTLLERCPATNIPFLTFAVPKTTARYFRVSPCEAGAALTMNELRLYPVVRVNMDTEKAGFFTDATLRDGFPTPATQDAVPLREVLDITSHYRNGRLCWKVPPGRWRIYRIGYTLRGRRNGPASPEATGLEVDKLDPQAILRYYRNYLDSLHAAGGGSAGRMPTSLMLDSYEAGCQTWTPEMPQEFERRRGYSMMPWLPALFGQVLESAGATDLFLQDWRQTIGEMLAEYHYEAVDTLLARYGMSRYTEAHEGGRHFLADGMDVRRHAAVPMAAFWLDGDHGILPVHEADIREAASVAHIYGQQLCAAESFTTDGCGILEDGRPKAWSFHPGSLKPYADAAMACGVNRFVLHCSPHQPSDSLVPGLTLGRFGQWFGRHETWAAEAKGWTDYLARSGALLSQGRFVADIALFYGETNNPTARFRQERAAVPEGYAFDFVNKSVLSDLLQPMDGMLATATGMRYRALLVDTSVRYCSLPVLRQLARFADAGVLLAARPPEGCVNLHGDRATFDSLVAAIWHAGRNNVVPPESLAAALEQRGCPKDVLPLSDSMEGFRFVHRQLEEGELYWVTNSCPQEREVEVSFRVSGRKPVVLHAETGLTEEVSYTIRNGRTSVRLNFAPDDALFVWFGEPAEQDSVALPPVTFYPLCRLHGPWQVAFQPRRGAPDTALFDTLISFSRSSLPGIRYFSGTALYTQSFVWDSAGVDADALFLDLGEVRHLARVFLNGTDLGLVWKSPYRLPLDGCLRNGVNRLEVRVTNTWANRMVGDMQPDMPEKVTWTSYPYFRSNTPLDEAGLLGPVRIVGQAR